MMMVIYIPIIFIIDAMHLVRLKKFQIIQSQSRKIKKKIQKFCKNRMPRKESRSLFALASMHRDRLLA